MRIGKRLAATVLAAGLLGTVVMTSFGDVPKDWPQFRGPARDNVSKETGLLKEWSKEGPPLAWKIKGIGSGYSSVALVNGRLYTSGETGDASYAIALNESDGKEVWRTKIGPAANPDKRGAGPRATPTVDGEMLYVLGQLGDVSCLRVADGNEVWHENLHKEFGGKTPTWGNSDPLLVEGEMVLGTAGSKQGTVVALDKRTGKLMWQSKELTEPIEYIPLMAADLAGARQIIVSTQKTVAGLSPKDGSLLWKTARKGRVAVIPTPIVYQDHVFVAAGYGEGDSLFKITSEGGKFAATQVYATKNMVNHHGGVILLDGNLYGYSDGKGWVCMDFMTGKVKWNDKDVLGKGAIAYADGRFYLREENKGTMALIEANPEKCVEQGRFEQPERSREHAWAHPVIANGKLYLRDMDTLLCYDVKGK
jgi:outer membrane protein assembly factor BamB